MKVQKSLPQRVLFVITHPRIYWDLMRYQIRLCLERINGVDFSKVEQAPALNFDDYRLIGYWSSANEYLDDVLRTLQIAITDKVLDIGCGKGAALVKFKKMGFHCVDGLEYTEKLSEIARRNMGKLNLNCQIFQSDARLFSNYHEYNYFYLYNPFTGDIMREVMEKIEASLQSHPRKVTIIYKNAVCDEIVIFNGVFKRIKALQNQPNEKPFVVYSNVMK